MSKKYAFGDCHLGHKNIANFRTQFKTAEEHDEFVLDSYMSVVTKRDIVIFTGDIAFNHESLAKIKKLPGEKILIVGNHCTERGIKMKDLCDVYGRVFASYSKGGLLFTHMPVHPQELRGKYNVHGHVHSATIPDSRYYNTSLENINYKPKDIQEIKAELEEANNGSIRSKLRRFIGRCQRA